MQKEDVIYRQAAIDAMADTLWHYPNECYKNLNSYEFAKALAELGLKSVPFAQSEIIRCDHCEYYKPMSNHWGQCRAHNNQTCQICDYCSWAERRTDETD